MNEINEHQTSPQSDMEVEDEFANKHDLPVSKGYVEAKPMPLDYSTIMRAQEIGIVDSLSECVENFLVGLEQAKNRGKQL